MANGEIKTVKHKDYTVAVPTSQRYGNTELDIDAERVVGTILFGGDSLWYNIATPSIDFRTTPPTVNINLSSNPTAQREYTVRVFYI